MKFSIIQTRHNSMLLILVLSWLFQVLPCSAGDESLRTQCMNVLKETIMYKGGWDHDFYCNQGDGILIDDPKFDKFLSPQPLGCYCQDSYRKQINQFYTSDSTMVWFLAHLASDGIEKDSLLQASFQAFCTYTCQWNLSTEEGDRKDKDGVVLHLEKIGTLVLLHNYLAMSDSFAVRTPVHKMGNTYCLYTFTPKVISDWIVNNWGSLPQMRERFRNSPPAFSPIYFK